MVYILLADSEKCAALAAHSSPSYPIPTIWGAGEVLDGSQAPQVGPGEGSVGVDRPATFTGELGLPVTGRTMNH